jgi:hypothetical protein
VRVAESALLVDLLLGCLLDLFLNLIFHRLRRTNAGPMKYPAMKGRDSGCDLDCSRPVAAVAGQF